MLINKTSLALSAIISVLALGGCVKEEIRYVEKQAPENILESFSPRTGVNAKACKSARCITIQKDSLGKVFLLMASGITVGPTPQWLDLKPQVVSFESSGDEIALVGENYKSIYEEIKSRHLLQTFKIVAETEESITFDWGSGLKTFVVEKSYDTEESLDGSASASDDGQLAVNVVDAFTKDIKFSNDLIEVNQLSKIMSSKILVGNPQKLATENQQETVDMNIQILPYKLSADFKSKGADSSRRVGFFVTKVSKKGYSQALESIITKWDISENRGPIKVLVTSAVPAEFLPAVTEGVLYWNKVYGREVLAVETGVSPQVKPQHRTMIIRWIPWLDSGAAYAMPQSDPLTGEILRAQVFLPSVFTKVGSADLVSLNKGMPIAAGNAVQCDLTKSLASLDKLMLSAPPNKRSVLAANSVRMTVAHEVGHALGLRHNFAGSFSSKVSYGELQKSADNYLENEEHQGLETSTTVMDYLTGLDEMLASSRLKHEALSYDKMAMQWAYQEGDSVLSEKVSLYCSDEDIIKANKLGLKIYGCERFDAGANPLERKVRDFIFERESLMKVLFASLIHRYTDKEDSAYLLMNTAVAKTMKWSRAQTTLEEVSDILTLKSSNNQPVHTMASLGSVKSGNLHMSKYGLDDELDEKIAMDVFSLGGYGKILKDLFLSSEQKLNVDWIGRQLADLEKENYYAHGTALNGVPYSLTAAEISLLQGFFKNVVQANSRSLFEEIVNIVPMPARKIYDGNGREQVVSQSLRPKIVESGTIPEIVSVLIQALTTNTHNTVDMVGIGQVNRVEVPNAALNLELRKSFAGLSSARLSNADMVKVRDQALQAQKNRLQAVLTHVDPGLNIGSTQVADKVADKLLEKGLVRTSAWRWLRDELDLYYYIQSL